MNDYPTSPGWQDLYRDPGRAASYEERRTRSFLARLSWSREQRLARALVERAGGKAWLDLACGPGRFLETLPRPAVGIDLSRAMLDLAAPRAKEVAASLVVASGAKLPFKSGAFDGVLCVRFLHHLARDVRLEVLAEARRVSRRWAVLGFPLDGTLRTLLRRLRARPIGPRRSSGEIRDELALAGWEVVASERVVPVVAETALFLAEKRA